MALYWRSFLNDQIYSLRCGFQWRGHIASETDVLTMLYLCWFRWFVARVPRRPAALGELKEVYWIYVSISCERSAARHSVLCEYGVDFSSISASSFSLYIEMSGTPAICRLLVALLSPRAGPLGGHLVRQSTQTDAKYAQMDTDWNILFSRAPETMLTHGNLDYRISLRGARGVFAITDRSRRH